MAQKPFQTEVSQLLKLIIHSLYSHKEIFLRELISNSSDALDKLRYLTLTKDEYKSMKFEPKVSIDFVEGDNPTLTITDTGIGMSKKELDINKIYSKKEFQKKFDNNSSNIDMYGLILGTFKSSIRLFFSDINDKIFREKNLELVDFSIHKKYLEKVLKENIDLNNKRIMIVLPINPWQKVINFPKNTDQIEYILVNLNESDLFIIDDHPNKFGHLKLANILFDYF